MTLFAGVVVFIAGWLGVSALLSVIGGWFWLARAYPCPPGRRFETRITFGSISLNWFCSYRRCVTVGADVEGLYLRPILPFRFMHRAVMIPWEQMAVAQTGRLLWTYAFEILPERGSPVIQIYGNAATLTKAACPLPTGTGAWRAIAIQNVIAFALVFFFGSLFMRNIHIYNTARPMTAFATTKSSLKAPLSKLAWTLGDWTCTSANATQSKNRVAYHVVPESGGNAINYTTVAPGYTDEGRTMWNAAKGAFVDETVALTARGPMRMMSVMRPAEISESRFVFTGNLSSGTFKVGTRQVTTRTGLDAFTVATAYRVRNQWQATDFDSCRRISGNFGITTPANPI